MIVKENLEISGRAFVKHYSDSGFYIERDGVIEESVEWR